MSESVILCEGYLDRAFWAGWLAHLGCTIRKERGQVYDALGRPVHKGQHMYRSRSDRFVRVVPCHGKPNVRLEARERLSQRSMRPRLTHLILNVDPDIGVDAPGGATGLRRQDVHAFVRQFDPEATERAEGDIALDAGGTLVSLVRWEAENHDLPGVPTQQTLERVVCIGLVAAYPERGPAVDQWLNSRPSPPQANPKEFGWSYMAGWYSQYGCEAFYQLLWQDGAVAAELESRLRACGAWRVAEALAR